MMNRNRQGGRGDRPGGRFMGNRGGGLGDGLLGEGPGMGNASATYQDQLVNQQLMLAQSLLQQQQALSQQVSLGLGAVAPGLGDPLGGLAGSMGNRQFMQQQQQNRGFAMSGRMGGGGGTRMHDSGDRKRMGQSRDRHSDAKRRRQDSTGRGGERDSRPRNKDSSRGGEGGRNRPSRWDTADKKTSGNDDYDPAEPTEAEEVNSNRENRGKDKDGNHFCHVCNISAYDEESFRRHLNGMKHASRMNSLLTVHEMKSNQLKSRLKAEEHLRSIERKGGRDPEYFCKICNNDLTLPWKRHCFSNIHKQRLLQVRRGCGWCNVHNFTNFSEVLTHRETEEHKKNAEIYGKKDKTDKKENDKQRSRSKDRKTERSGSDRKDRKPKPKEEEEDLTIPDFDPEKPVGLTFIIPVTGFFCKLCLKFYNNEKSAKGAHCQSEGHYQKFKAATEAKIAAREKRKAEEAEAEAKRKEEEEREKEKLKEQEEAEDEDEEMKEDPRDEEDEDNRQNGGSNLIDDDEDYDDELPLVDEDGEGGNIENLMDDDEGLLHPDESGAGAFLDDTNADASFEFLSGDMAQAHLELQRAEEILMQQHKEKKESQEREEVELAEDDTEAVDTSVGLDGSDDAELLAEVTTSVDISLDVSQEPERDTEKTATLGSQDPEERTILEAEDTKLEESKETGSSQEVEPVVETPVVAKATARRGTARRGRGKGRGKK